MVSSRPLGRSGIQVSPVALGCWPLAGITSGAVAPATATAIVHAALDHGVNFFDTAYMYGYEGESERFLGAALRDRRDDAIIATKCGLHFNADHELTHDARPATLRRQCETSLTRLGVETVDVLYLHAPDPATPLADSVGELIRLRDEGKCRCVGGSNLSAAQCGQFHALCPLAVIQPYYNMLQRQAERDLLPWATRHDVAVVVYWPLLKGLLTGKFAVDHEFPPGDSRRKYPLFQGEQWRRNLRLVDRLRDIADAAGQTVSQLVIAWTISQPGVTAALCGAKLPEQIAETAAALEVELTDALRGEIAAALNERGEAESVGAV